MSEKSEGDVIKAIDDAMSGVDEQAQKRVGTWFNLKFSNNEALPSVRQSESVKQPHPVKAVNNKKLTGAKKSKTTFKRIKDWDLSPPSKISASAFANEKNPTSQKQKCVVAAYYISHILEFEAVTIDHIFSFFKDLNWIVPANLPNTLHQAGSEGWLDTSDSENLIITNRGENLIEHQLPTAKAKV
jgi:hypothetical protein